MVAQEVRFLRLRFLSFPPQKSKQLAYTIMKTEAEVETKVTTHVEYYYPGVFFAEKSSKQVENRNPQEVELTDYCYAFQFYDLEIITVKLENGKVLENKAIKNKSHLFYPNATVLTLEDVENMSGDHFTLIANMRCNRWKKVVKTRVGNYQPYNEETDEVIYVPQIEK